MGRLDHAWRPTGGGRVEDGGSFDAFHLPTVATGVATTSLTWNGCIEERETVDTITSTSGYAIPSDAYDLDINLVPTIDDDTRWRPHSRHLLCARLEHAVSAPRACPAAARRLTAWQRADMQTYVNGLLPTGNTYHDTGMIWGARMISSGGIFADSPDAFGGMPVSRHIIFMSDGQMDTDRSIYALYGVERYDQRISGMSSPSEAELNGRHMQRFKMICNAAKSMNVSIWVIAFGTALSPEMLECASNANQASTVDRPRRADRPLPPDRQPDRRAEADPMSRLRHPPPAPPATRAARRSSSSRSSCR